MEAEYSLSINRFLENRFRRERNGKIVFYIFITYMTVYLLECCKVNAIPLQYLSQNNQYREIGDSNYDGSPVYLDLSSIEQTNSTKYYYTIVSNLGANRIESDVFVDCNNLFEVTVLQARYYRNEQPSSTESINRVQTIGTNSVNQTWYNANLIVCQDLEN